MLLNLSLRLICVSLVAFLFAAPNTCFAEEVPLVVQAIIKKANLKNGRTIYNTGKHANGNYVSFRAGPSWLHSEGGGCAACHGKNGRGGLEPAFCFGKTPPIAFKFLAGDGYPPAKRKSGEHPAYTIKEIRYLIEDGSKPNNYELDYCMPRYKLSETDFFDLLGYLIDLDKHP